MKINPWIGFAILAFLIALGVVVRINSVHSDFRKVVRESLAVTEGYDQQFINLVDHLEDVLTTRASFPYPGGKDPMTGRRREIASSISGPAINKPATRRNLSVLRSSPVKSDTILPVNPPFDRVRLTAIIADDYAQHTAIVMDGERSVSVDVGDMVGSRRVIRITAKELTMEDDSTIYTYSLSGTRNQQRK